MKAIFLKGHGNQYQYLIGFGESLKQFLLETGSYNIDRSLLEAMSDTTDVATLPGIHGVERTFTSDPICINQTCFYSKA